MRRGLFILAVAALISIVADIMIAPSEPGANMAQKGQPQNVVSVHGLHVALPQGMRTLPAELVPLP